MKATKIITAFLFFTILSLDVWWAMGIYEANPLWVNLSIVFILNVLIIGGTALVAFVLWDMWNLAEVFAEAIYRAFVKK